MTANNPMTGEQMDELMTVAVNMQRDSEKAGDRPSAMFAYAVQVAVLELRKVRNDAAALAAENAGLKKYICDECYVENIKTGATKCAGLGMPETPATDAFLAEVRAHGVEASIATAKNVVAQEFQYKDFETAQRVCSKFPESDLVGKVEMVEWLEDFAAQLRKGVQS
ncbi:hypothetical protein [Enterobacter cloacae]|uniref:hypothetical protein n=1 Tax=Enterobacter cloacae TaxID=550 RepID=UPI003204AB0B